MRIRWLGRVPYREAWDLQRAISRRSTDDYLLLLEHPPVYTLGANGDPDHVLVDPASVGADWSGSTGAATSPTTAPASWSAIRCSPWVADSTVGPSTSTGSSRWSSTPWSPSGWRRPAWAGWPATRACGWVWTMTADGGGTAEDLRRRGPHLEGPDHPRLRPQRDHRPRHVRPHRALRHRRPTGDLAAAEGIGVAMAEVVDAVIARRRRSGVPPTTSSG